MSVEDNIAAVLEMTDKPLDYQKDKLESLNCGVSFAEGS